MASGILGGERKSGYLEKDCGEMFIEIGNMLGEENESNKGDKNEKYI